MGRSNIIKQRLGAAVKDFFVYQATMQVPALSPQHFRGHTERTAGPLVKLVEMLSATDPAKLATFRSEYDALAAEYFDGNAMKQDFLITRAVNCRRWYINNGIYINSIINAAARFNSISNS